VKRRSNLVIVNVDGLNSVKYYVEKPWQKGSLRLFVLGQRVKYTIEYLPQSPSTSNKLDGSFILIIQNIGWRSMWWNEPCVDFYITRLAVEFSLRTPLPPYSNAVIPVVHFAMILCICKSESPVEIWKYGRDVMNQWWQWIPRTFRDAQSGMGRCGVMF
jgi:hypothetical protein